MNIIYFDCASGISSQALLGALIDSGVDQETLLKELKDSIQTEFRMSFKKSLINNVSATGVVLETNAGAQEVNIVEFAERAAKKAGISNNAISDHLYNIFMTYAAAVAKLFNLPPQKTTMRDCELLHIQILSTAYFAALRMLGVQKVTACPLPVYGHADGSTAAASDPFVLELARGASVRASNQSFACEALGTALLTASAGAYGRLPEMYLGETGYGVLAKDGRAFAALRAVRGVDKTDPDLSGGVRDSVVVIETSIDDMNPEIYPYLIERLLKIGALDAFMTPIYMKKGRPANLLTVLCRKESLNDTLDTIFKEATTLGVRIREENRRVLRRKFFEVSTPYGMISIKAGYLKEGEEPVQVAPEYEDCKKIAASLGVPVKEVYAAAQHAAFNHNKK